MDAEPPGATRGGGILVLLDADDQCPVTLGSKIRSYASARVGARVEVVVAKREYEAWIFAGVEPYRQHLTRGVEATRCKTLLRNKVQADYNEPRDQVVHTRLIDVEQAAEHSASFAYLDRCLTRLGEPDRHPRP